MEKTRDNHIVYVDLTNEKITRQEITPDIRKKYIGGIGINTKILYDSEAIINDALSEKNVLIFGVGPAVGTGLLAGNRCTITAKSPVTDRYGDSNIGGDFTVRMRSVGIDNLVFTGKANKPVYLHIDSQGEVKIIDASDLWGMWTDKVTDILTERHGEHCEVACIGPGGEKLIRYASVIMSKCHAAGRMGMGCVMGSKNLKAIVIEKGNLRPKIYNQEKIKEIRDLWIKNCRGSVVSKMGSVNGTLFLLETYDKDKHIPVRNCKSAHDEKTKNIYPASFKADFQTKRKSCYACPVGCSKEYEIKEGKYKGEKGDRIDYGAAVSVGPNLGIFDWASIIHLKLLTDYLGVDSIELAGVIGLIIECLERGIITEADLDGRKIQFGDDEAIEYLIHKTIDREGIGDLIAEGTYRAAKALGAEDYAFCINKSTTGTQSKDRLAWSLGYLTSTRGGDHLKNFPYTMLSGGYFAQVVAKHVFNVDAKKVMAHPDQKGRVVWWHENYKYVVDSLGICIFAIHGLPNTGTAFFQDFANIMNYLYGYSLTDKDIFYAGERIYQLQNAFNVHCGLTLEDYQWPVRKKDPDIDEEYIQETTIDIRDEPGMLPEYFLYRGLTKDGKPTLQRFLELGLEDYVDKTKLVDHKEAQNLKVLLTTVGLNIKLTLGDRIKGFIISQLLCRLLDLKDKSEKKKYLKEKAKAKSNQFEEIKQREETVS